MICMCGLKQTQFCKLCVLWENNVVKKLSQTENPNPLKDRNSIWEFRGKGCKREKSCLRYLSKLTATLFHKPFEGFFFLSEGYVI